MNYSGMSLRQTEVDLHAHSTASDGQLSPTQLIEKAIGSGVRLLALTDHDTINGLKEAREAAVGRNIQLVSGVELSARWCQHSIHIIGLNFDAEGYSLTNGLAQLRQLRTQRAVAIAEKLEDLGISGALSWTSKQVLSTQITRAHFARLLVERKYCRTIQQAFKKYLGPGKLLYVECNWPPMKEALDWIRASGGCSVLAHPLRYGLDVTQLTQLLHEFKTAGGDAIEIYSGTDSSGEIMICTRYARQFNLKASIGSDYHGETQRRSRLGATCPFSVPVQPVWEIFR